MPPTLTSPWPAPPAQFKAGDRVFGLGNGRIFNDPYGALPGAQLGTHLPYTPSWMHQPHRLYAPSAQLRIALHSVGLVPHTQGMCIGRCHVDDALQRQKQGAVHASLLTLQFSQMLRYADPPLVAAV